jgi:hypothetical protein
VKHGPNGILDQRTIAMTIFAQQDHRPLSAIFLKPTQISKLGAEKRSDRKN